MARAVYTDTLTGSAIALDDHAYALLDTADRTHGHKPVRSLFFPGCSIVNFAQPLMGKAYKTLLDAGIVEGISLLCCGKLLAFEPDADTVCPAFEAELRDSVFGKGIERIVTACPNCTAEMRRVLARDEKTAAVEVIVLPEALVSCGVSLSPADVRAFFEENGIPFAGDAPELAVHDSCPDRKTGEFARGTRSLLPSELLVEMEHNRTRSICCGSLAKAAGKSDAATRQSQMRGEEGLAAGADAIVTACMSCASQLSSFQDSLPVIHYLELLYGERIDWANLPPYLQMRFLFEAKSGKRDYCGLTDGCSNFNGCCAAGAGVAANADGTSDAADGNASGIATASDGNGR